ncbi:acetyl-CoA C-acetyltransferase [Streptomyces melanosporofaciens]|uniref:Acetyl-CoA C-acetyltransferase n=1 Tax=Streptomyces melanosporofaciens TaxID=67327 RepID=A0A1H4Z6L5_STRMJ|nr:acetyl-CoA C-acetyltransferase [Streptomyces melanosporofaciens]
MSGPRPIGAHGASVDGARFGPEAGAVRDARRRGGTLGVPDLAPFEIHEESAGVAAEAA